MRWNSGFQNHQLHHKDSGFVRLNKLCTQLVLACVAINGIWCSLVAHWTRDIIEDCAVPSKPLGHIILIPFHLPTCTGIPICKCDTTCKIRTSF